MFVFGALHPTKLLLFLWHWLLSFSLICQHLTPFIADLWTVQRVNIFSEESSTLWHEKHLGTKNVSMHVCISVCVCVHVCFHAHFWACLDTITHMQIFKHTHSDVMCVCFTFSILGCCCFVAVLGAAAQRVEAEEEGEVLDRHRCLLALAALRHAKWFQVGTHSLPVFVPGAYCSLTIYPESTQPPSAYCAVIIPIPQFLKGVTLHFLTLITTEIQYNMEKNHWFGTPLLKMLFYFFKLCFYCVRLLTWTEAKR